MTQAEFNTMLLAAIAGGVFDADSFQSQYTGAEIEAYLTKMKNSPAGSTTMDAEIIDMRTAYDGTVYPTAGDAVRTFEQIAADAVPNTRTVNGKQLNADITLNADDVGAANPPTFTTATMLAASWVSNTYSFEADYPSADYNIEVSVADTATAEQFEAAGAAYIGSSATSNVFTAKGDVPTVDIPVIVKVVAK